LIAISSARGVTRVASDRKSPSPLNAMPTPTSPPVSVTQRLSVASWRNSRCRDAPSAERSATSRPRCICRERIRFAKFAAATSSTNAAMASSVKSSGRDCCVISSCIDTVST
jgi:hypothetical protein